MISEVVTNVHLLNWAVTVFTLYEHILKTIDHSSTYMYKNTLFNDNVNLALDVNVYESFVKPLHIVLEI